MMDWFRRRKELQPALLPQVRDQLREFIYLDTVSVYSLLASRTGAIPEEAKASAEGSVDVDASGKASKNLLVLQGEASVGASYRRSTGSEILSKFNVQASFKQLVDLETDRLYLCGGSIGDKGPLTAVQLAAQSQQLARDRLLLAEDELARGKLVEVDVELDVEPLYRMMTVFSGMMGMLSSSPEMFENSLSGQLEQGRAVEVALRSLLGGLVPIRARVPDYVGITVGGAFSLIHKDLLAPAERHEAHPVNVVGVAEESLFWKDLRRVLFSGGRYRVLARLAAHGLQESWNPLKLAHVLETFAPDLGATMNELSLQALESTPKAKADKAPAFMQAPLRALLEVLKGKYPVAEAALESATAVVQRYERVPFSLETWRPSSKEVADTLLGTGGSVSANELATLRSEVLAKVEGRDRALGSQKGGEHRGSERFLDCEIVAMYW
jgi:hypothetical protein